MSLQISKNSDGKDTGVFIPIVEWNEISQKHADLRDLVEPEFYSEKEIKKLADSFVFS